MNLRFDRLLSLLSTGIFLLVSLPSNAASFDCGKAASATEKAICADSKLSALDNKLSIVWKKVSGFDPVAMKSSQLQWLKLRDACGADASCLSACYSERLAVLEWVASQNAQFPLDVDQAGNRLEALMLEKPVESTDDDARRCTADKRFCVQVLHKDKELTIEYAETNPSTYGFMLPEPHDADVTVWSRVLRLASDNGAILVGAMYNVTAAYSGGGGSALELRLFRVSRNGTTFHANEVLTVPMSGGLSIRACFSEQDMRNRLDACHDEYTFSASLGLDRTVESGYPSLVYQTRATSFPGKVSRSEDSLMLPPLRKRDLVAVVDPLCTYKRTFRFMKTTGVYMPDKSLPDCSNYTVP